MKRTKRGPRLSRLERAAIAFAVNFQHEQKCTNASFVPVVAVNNTDRSAKRLADVAALTAAAKGTG